MKESIIEKLELPDLSKKRDWKAKEIKELQEKVETYVKELGDYTTKLYDLVVEVVNIPKMKELLGEFFNSHPEIKFIGFVNRVCGDDDSGNCSWGDSTWDQIFINNNDEVVEISEKQLSEFIREQASELFTESYPDLSFEDEDNAYWDSRADQWYGITRDMKPAFWADYDEDEDNDTPVFEII